jgi:hypothetical protein
MYLQAVTRVCSKNSDRKEEDRCVELEVFVWVNT